MTCLVSDAIVFLDSLPRNSVDLILSDPPYESLERHRAKGTTTRLKQSEGSSNQWFSTVSNDYLHRFMVAAYSVLKPERHFFLYCDDETLVLLWRLAEIVGFYPWKKMPWVKTVSAGDLVTEDIEVASAEVRPGTGYHYGASHENILFLEKCSVRYEPPPFPSPRSDPKGARRQLNDLGSDAPHGQGGDVFFAPRPVGYPTEKPVSIAQVLISKSTMPGELVVDPFCGSGSTGEAAKFLSRQFIGCDISPLAVQMANDRISSSPVLDVSSCTHPFVRPPPFSLKRAMEISDAREIQRIYPPNVKRCPHCGVMAIRFASEKHQSLSGPWPS